MSFSFSPRPPGLWRVAALAMLLTSACSDSADPETPEARDGSVAGSPDIVAFWQVAVPDGRVNYVSLLSSLDAGTTVDTDAALEVPGFARLFVPERGRDVFIARDEDLAVQKYTIADDGSFIEGPGLSFQSLGTTYFSFQNVFVSATKAYYFDDSTNQVVVWNPDSMELITTIPLPMVDRSEEGFIYAVPLPDQRLVRDDGTVLVPFGWANTDFDQFLESTGLLVVDSETDEVVAFVEDERCRSALELAIDTDGTAYFGTWNYAIDYDLETRATGEKPSCMLRVNPGEAEFDPDYFVQLEDIADGRLAVNPRNGPTPGTAILRVLDETIVDYERVDGATLQSAAAYDGWLVMDLSTGSAEFAPRFGKSVSDSPFFEVRGVVYSGEVAEDFSEVEFTAFTTEGVEPALTIPGFVTVLAPLGG